MQPIDSHVGRRIRERREALGHEPRWLADGLGCSVAVLADWEAGRARVGGAQLFRLGGLLGVPLTWFFEDLSPDLNEPAPPSDPAALRSAIEMLYAQAPRADPPLGARMLSMARTLERTADGQERISRQVMSELDQLLAQWRAPGT